MKSESKNKHGRYKYFKMSIHLGLISLDSEKNLWEATTATLIDIFGATKFVPQLVLENILYELEIQDRGRSIQLDEFSSQLEKDSYGIPFWNVSLKTKHLTTPLSVRRAVSKKIFDTAKIDRSIKIYATQIFKEIHRKRVLTILDSNWYPGYFSQRTVALAFLLKTEDVKESIQATPHKYKISINAQNNLVDGFDLDLN
jgi:hypothetical protein